MRTFRLLITTIIGAAVLGCVTHAAAPRGVDAGSRVFVILATSAGDIEVEVFADRAPLSAADFLRYVDRGLYDGAAFFRLVRADNDHGNPKIQVIQGGLLDESKALPPIAHETTRESGITHLDGTLSLARGAPGTGGADAFFICVGDQPALDFGATRNPDGQGFAAFGRVARGMEVVRKIHAMEADGPSPSEYMRGQILSEPVVIRKAWRKRWPNSRNGPRPPSRQGRGSGDQSPGLKLDAFPIPTHLPSRRS